MALSKGLAGDELISHHAEDASHSSAAVVQLNIQLLRLLVRREEFSEVAGAVVAGVVEAIEVDGFEETNEDDDLRPGGIVWSEGTSVRRARDPGGFGTAIVPERGQEGERRGGRRCQVGCRRICAIDG